MPILSIKAVIYSLLSISFTLLSFNTFANPAINSLMQEVKSESIFIIKQEHPKCPDAITVIDTSSDKEQSSDSSSISLYLSPSKADGSYDKNFTHEGNSVLIRTDLPIDIKSSFDRDTFWKNGPGYLHRSQEILNGVIETEYIFNLFIINEFAKMYAIYRLTYDSNNKTITYYFDGNGVDSITCIYQK